MALDMDLELVSQQQKQPMLATEKDGSSSGDPSSVHLASQTIQPSQPSVNVPPLNQQTPPRPLRRFLQRAIVCIVLPPALLTYYIWTYAMWLAPSSNPTVSLHGAVPNAKYVWWSWFVLGAIAPGISTYSLAGVEASMLMTKFWGAGNARQILLHCDRSWSGLSGWKIVLTVVVNHFSKRRRARQTLTGLWLVLFVLSTLSWSFALSGLTLQTENAFVVGHTVGAEVLGLNASNFDQRLTLQFMTEVLHHWQLGTEPRLPLAGSLLVEVRNSQNPNTSSTDTLPPDPSSHIFLTTQANTPVTGKAWGLAFQYGCTTVQHLQDFSILSKRNASENGTQLVQNIPEAHGCYNVFDDSWICVQNQTMGASQGGLLTNIKAWMEVGANIQRNVTGPGYPSTFASAECPGLDHEDILEMLLWEHIDKGSDGGGIPVQSPVSGIEDPHLDANGLPMDAVGLRCTSTSAVGFADINGLAGTFSNFQRTDAMSGSKKETPGIADPLATSNSSATTTTSDGGVSAMGNDTAALEASLEIPGNGGKRGNIRRLGVGVSQLFFLDNYLYNFMDYSNWITPLFSSAGFTPVTQDDPAALASFTNYASVLQADDLKRSVLLAYKHYAVQAVYNGQDGGQSRRDGLWHSPDVNAAVASVTLAKDAGGVPPLLVVVLMLLWALGCMVLGVTYGLRKRWAEVLDGFSLFCFGADAVQRYLSATELPSAMDDYNQAPVLRLLPGLIGDADSGSSGTGRITLVDSNVAVSNKLYK